MKVLIALRGSMRGEDTDRLHDLGYEVTWVNDVDSVRQLESTSLRDYFAAAALNGILSHPDVLVAMTKCEEKGGEPYALAKSCYEAADAMLREREK